MTHRARPERLLTEPGDAWRRHDRASLRHRRLPPHPPARAWSTSTGRPTSATSSAWAASSSSCARGVSASRCGSRPWPTTTTCAAPDEFDELFGGLAIGGEPTPLANRYFVLQWNFSTVDPSGGVEQIAESLREHVSAQAEAFAADYEEHLPAPIETDGSPAAILDSLLGVVRKTPYKLYLLIDEYDNFVNEVMAEDVDTYHALFGRDGPYKQLFKSVKNATEGQGLERVFVTGVSPVALNDLTSGFNIAEDVSLSRSWRRSAASARRRSATSWSRSPKSGSSPRRRSNEALDTMRDLVQRLPFRRGRRRAWSTTRPTSSTS